MTTFKSLIAICVLVGSFIGPTFIKPSSCLASGECPGGLYKCTKVDKEGNEYKTCDCPAIGG
jgi:hypothetical protein